MRAMLAVSCLLCLGACHKSAPREMTEDEKWAAALAAGPLDPSSLKEFVVMPLAEPSAAADVSAERPEVAFYAPLPDGWTRLSDESAMRPADERFVNGSGDSHVDFKVLSGVPERLAEGLAKKYEGLGFEVRPVDFSADGTRAEFTYVNRIAFDVAFPEKPPIGGRVYVRHPIGWPLHLVLMVEGSWPDEKTGQDYGTVWNIMEGVVTQ